ncbi:MAG: uncharacterized protein JWQ53_440 [Klenkia sp.]|nr:uncharacterized protein [Klenkia sp.]
MRWEQLFADLEAQFEVEESATERAEGASRARAEVGRLRWVDRLGGARGHRVGLTCTGAGEVTGRVVDLGPDWVLLVDEQQREHLVATATVCALVGLGAATTVPVEEGAVARAWDLRRAVRGLARDRAPLRCVLVEGTVLTGTVDRVGADYLELAEHPADEPRRRGAVRQVRTVVLTAVAVVSPAVSSLG